MSEGFVKLRRAAEATELLNDPNAFTLLTVIALRARRPCESTSTAWNWKWDDVRRHPRWRAFMR
jgi:hypothetical protein